MKKKICKVVADYKTPFPDPLKLQKNEEVRIEEKESESPGWIWCISKEGKEGWIPYNYIDIQGNIAKLIRNYDATELTVTVGEELVVEDQESGWIWVSSKEGRRGWVPLKNVQLLE